MVPKRHFPIANRRSVPRVFALSCIPVTVYVEALDYTSATTTGQKSTECDRKSTGCDISVSFARTSMSFGDTFASLHARREFRVTSDRLRFFDFANSCRARSDIELSRNDIEVRANDIERSHPVDFRSHSVDFRPVVSADVKSRAST